MADLAMSFQPAQLSTRLPPGARNGVYEELHKIYRTVPPSEKGKEKDEGKL